MGLIVETGCCIECLWRVAQDHRLIGRTLCLHIIDRLSLKNHRHIFKMAFSVGKVPNECEYWEPLETSKNTIFVQDTLNQIYGEIMHPMCQFCGCQEVPAMDPELEPVMDLATDPAMDPATDPAWQTQQRTQHNRPWSNGPSNGPSNTPSKEPTF